MPHCVVDLVKGYGGQASCLPTLCLAWESPAGVHGTMQLWCAAPYSLLACGGAFFFLWKGVEGRGADQGVPAYCNGPSGPHTVTAHHGTRPTYRNGPPGPHTVTAHQARIT